MAKASNIDVLCLWHGGKKLGLSGVADHIAHLTASGAQALWSWRCKSRATAPHPWTASRRAVPPRHDGAARHRVTAEQAAMPQLSRPLQPGTNPCRWYRSNSAVPGHQRRRACMRSLFYDERHGWGLVLCTATIVYVMALII
jgi:hypothetical protein